jgi:hypothetical protein
MLVGIRLLLVMASIGAASACADDPCSGGTNYSRASEFDYSVALTTVIASPERYSGRVVRTVGYLGALPGDLPVPALFIDEETFQRAWAPAGLEIEIVTDAQRAAFRDNFGCFVEVEGRLDARSKPLRGTFETSGSITNLSQLGRSLMRQSAEGHGHR